MPEGPEVFILAEVLKCLNMKAEAYGKHLLYTNPEGRNYDITFGLVGKISLLKLDNGYDIQKTVNTPLSGDIRFIPDFSSIKTNLGINWMTCEKEEVKKVVVEWSTRAKKIGALLLEQGEICGIGVAWGSEILHSAEIMPTDLANTINVDKLVDSIMIKQAYIREAYLNCIDGDYEYFVSRWFGNIYKTRHMEIYKKGKEVMVSGRKFYI